MHYPPETANVMIIAQMIAIVLQVSSISLTVIHTLLSLCSDLNPLCPDVNIHILLTGPLKHVFLTLLVQRIC